MTKDELKEALNFRFVDVWAPACGDWIRADKAEFAAWLETKCPASRQFKAEIVGLVVRIG